MCTLPRSPLAAGQTLGASTAALSLLVVLIAACKDGPGATGTDAARGRAVAEVRAMEPTLPGTDELLQSPPPDVSLATGGLVLPYQGVTPAGTSSPSLWIIQQGYGYAGLFVTGSTINVLPALYGSHYGGGAGVSGSNIGTGPGGHFRNSGASNTSPALKASTTTTGPVLHVDHQGTSGALAVFQTNGANRIRFSRNGTGYFNGGTQTGGADIAEAFEVEGRVQGYEPGDVLAISDRSDRRVEKSGEAYSTRVIGVYATKPGVLLTERDIDASLADMVPVGVVGVIPTKVSAENGTIRRGDLLVSAGTPGHAMAADRSRLGVGMVVGKALQGFTGPGTGRILVLVNVK
jgi:hypothetical protein